MLNIANNSPLNTAHRSKMIPRNKRKTSEIYPAGGALLQPDKQVQPEKHWKSPFRAWVPRDDSSGIGMGTTEKMFKQRGMENDANLVEISPRNTYFRGLHARLRRERDQYNAAKRRGEAV